MKIGTNYSSNSPRQNTPNFGALYMPKEKAIAKVLGDYIAAEAEKGRNLLQNLACDVDIFVIPIKKMNGMAIYVQEITQPIALTGNRITKAIKRFMLRFSHPRPNVPGTICHMSENFGYMLYEKALKQKINYNEFKKPHIFIPHIIRVRDVTIIDTSKTPIPYMKAS